MTVKELKEFSEKLNKLCGKDLEATVAAKNIREDRGELCMDVNYVQLYIKGDIEPFLRIFPNKNSQENVTEIFSKFFN
jgi:hypothetical protein